jgi:glycosyltransferase involved in cell wall biosynthesis
MKPRGMMVIHQFRPVTGGAELQAERLSIKLTEHGHLMQVLTELRTPNTPPEEEIHGVRIHRVDFRMAYGANFGMDAVDTFHYLYKNRHTYDILHAHQAFGHAVVSVVVAKMTGKRCIVKIACAGEFGDLKQADCVVALSQEVKAELLKEGFSSSQIATIPNGVDIDLFKRRQDFRPWDPFQFLLIGRRTPQKGIDIALQAVRLLKDQGLTRFKLSLRGRDDPEQNYPSLAQKLGIEDLVDFLPFTDAVLDAYHDAHCLILPSRNEGMSNTLLEAMSLEMPVIASTVSGTSEIVDHEINGILVPLEAPEVLAQAMQKVMENTDWAVNMGRQARLKVVGNFSLESVGQRYSKLYDHLYHGAQP